MEEIKMKNQGSITIEACIAVTLFMFFVLYIYSFFIVFEAQGKISSTLIRTTESLSLDSYAIEQLALDDGLETNVHNWIVELGINATNDNPEFVSTQKWYKSNEDGSKNDNLDNVIKERFCAYLTQEGTEEAANNLLETLCVDGGLSGMDFSESQVDASGNIVVVVNYELNYIFDYPLFNIEPLSLKQSFKSHMWGVK
ncbi:MAG: hypothetical protein ACI4ES_14605 [Roseburia sp.]